MSARIRHIKRRIRELEHFAADAVAALNAYERVIRDASGIADLTDIRRRHRWWCDRLASIGDDVRREQELLASMPKTLGASPHDPGDEQAASPKGRM